MSQNSRICIKLDWITAENSYILSQQELNRNKMLSKITVARIIVLITLVWASKPWKPTFVVTSKLLGLSACCFTEGVEVIVRALMSNGQVDPNAWQNLNDLQYCGTHSAIYMTPCVKCGNATAQANKVCDAFENLSVSGYGFIDVTDRNVWALTQQENIAFLKEFANAIDSRRRYSPAILTTKQSWEAIMGVDYSGHADKKLWYIHIDGDYRHKDFVPFGGWNTNPMKKTYKLNFSFCDVTEMDIGSECWDVDCPYEQSIESLNNKPKDIKSQ